MKKFKLTLCLLMLLSLVITAVLLQFMPDIIPAHYNAAGEIDRLGSKYESLVFPAATAVMGIFFLLMDKFVKKSKNMKEIEQKTFYLCGIFTELLFIGLGIFFMAQAISYGAGDTVSVPGVDTARFIAALVILIGALYIVIGIFMPNARVNYLFGIRTSWSMANEQVWKKSQRFGAVSSVLCGTVLIALGIFVREHLLLWVLGVLALWSIAAITASYLFWRADRSHG